MTLPTFSDLGVAESFLRVLTAENYQTPTPIQTRAIPLVLEGKDLLGIAQTGTGKTAAFSLPILQRLAETKRVLKPGETRALVLAPTRELAIQIFDSMKTYGRNQGLRYTAIYGGVGHKPQINAMRQGVDVLIATPGRLLDLFNQRQVRLDQVEFLVLDEADRMFDMGFLRDVRKIVAATPANRQSFLFSATMPADVAELATKVLRQPVRVEVTPTAIAVDRIEQSVFFADAKAKRGLLTELLANPALSRVIVFTRTKHGANRVSEHLENAGILSDAIHGNKSQAARQRALSDFRDGKVRVLVATDIASRGIDVDGVSHVINFELPNVPESYVHRIGRTARAGAEGTAISFCDPSERSYLRDIERLTKRPMVVVGNRGGEKRPQEERRMDTPRSANDSKKPFSNKRRRDQRGKRPIKVA